MMEMPIRAGRRMQDAVINWREKIAGIDEARQQHANIHRQRMTCADSVRTFQQAQDWTGVEEPCAVQVALKKLRGEKAK